MHWNYRVMKKDGGFAVYSVYYDERGNIRGCSEKPFSPDADSLEELKTTLELMLEALRKDVLEYQADPKPG